MLGKIQRILFFNKKKPKTKQNKKKITPLLISVSIHHYMSKLYPTDEMFAEMNNKII